VKQEILDLIDRYWKFDNNQTPVSNWHDKQDLLEAVSKALSMHNVVGRSEQLCRVCKKWKH
jgi:septum formation topological specificity factor MinE